MINEGLSEKRKYCTPLQGLFWIACDRNINKDNPLIGNQFTVEALLEDAWTNTKTSKYFSSEKWKNFEEVTDRLNSPQLIALYMKFNVSYSYTPNEKEGVKSAKEIFTAKKGACYDHALLASYLLKKNGYNNAWGTSVSFDKIVDGFYAGHIGNIYENPIDKQYYSMDFNEGGYYYVHGPFNSVEKAAEKICSIGSWGKAALKKYQCYEINLDKGTYIKISDYFFD